MAEQAGTAPPRVTLPLWQRIPIRRIILVALTVGIVSGVSIGSFKTLTADTAPSASFWRDQIIFGIAQGSIYALIALGYSLVYGILLMINFAHGEIFMVGAFGSLFVASTLADAGLLDSAPILSIVILLGVAMLISTSIAVGLERVAYRPIRNAPRLVPLITAIGASLFLQNSVRGFFGPQTYGYPVPDILDDARWSIFGVSIDRISVITVVAAALSLYGLTWFVAKTKTGRSMRAVSQDREIAALMGIDVNRVVRTTFAIGGMMAGVAGVLFAFTFGQVQFTMGFFPGIKAFTAAVLGGIGSIAGAAIGGLIIGLLEAIGPFLFLEGFGIPSPGQLQDVIAFTILVLVLIFRPGGILGTGEAEKV